LLKSSASKILQKYSFVLWLVHDQLFSSCSITGSLLHRLSRNRLNADFINSIAPQRSSPLGFKKRLNRVDPEPVGGGLAQRFAPRRVLTLLSVSTAVGLAVIGSGALWISALLPPH
jgi:hypothetical protein